MKTGDLKHLFARETGFDCPCGEVLTGVIS